MPQRPKAIGLIFSIIPSGIGLTVLIFLWSKPFDAWDSPPLIFRVFGSFIALAFLGFGAAAAFSFFGAKGDLTEQIVSSAVDQAQSAPPNSQTPSDYVCPRCAAPLAANPDVSPLGDVKCSHCGGWFNIHGRNA